MTAENENATKRLIRETATRLFREKSFEEVTLREICKASGINKHTFYYYFKSKDELLKYYYRFPWQLSAAEASDILTSDNYVDQLWLIVQKFTDYIQQAGVPIVRQIFIKNLTNDVGTFRVSHEMREMCRLEMTIIRKGQQSGQFRNHADPKVLVVLLEQMLYSLSLIWTVFQGEFSFHTYARFLMDNLLDVDTPFRFAPDENIDDFTDLFREHNEPAAQEKPSAENAAEKQQEEEAED